jgi:transcriptional regulator with XRE-family HTH domain
MMPAMTSPLGKIIKARLAELRKTQEWLAEQTGVSTAAVSKWMRNGTISRDSLGKAAKALQLTTDQLMGDQPPVVNAVSSSETTLERLDAEEKRVLELYRRATHDGKLMILGAATVAPKESDSGTLFSRPQ